jgi:hypothetical protein
VTTASYLSHWDNRGTSSFTAERWSYFVHAQVGVELSERFVPLNVRKMHCKPQSIQNFDAQFSGFSDFLLCSPIKFMAQVPIFWDISGQDSSRMSISPF